MNTHFHVVAFQNGCLNDYDSGPIEDRDLARLDLEDYLDCYRDMNADGAEYVLTDTGHDRWEVTHGEYGAGFIVKIEECGEDCTHEDFL